MSGLSDNGIKEAHSANPLGEKLTGVLQDRLRVLKRRVYQDHFVKRIAYRYSEQVVSGVGH